MRHITQASAKGADNDLISISSNGLFQLYMIRDASLKFAVLLVKSIGAADKYGVHIGIHALVKRDDEGIASYIYNDSSVEICCKTNMSSSNIEDIENYIHTLESAIQFAKDVREYIATNYATDSAKLTSPNLDR